MSEQVITDHVPDADEAARIMRPNMVDPLESIDQTLRYGQRNLLSEDSEDLHRALLGNIGTELQWGDPEGHDELVAKAYGVARRIGDDVLARQNAGVVELLNETRKDARFGVNFVGQSMYNGEPAPGGHVTQYLTEEGSIFREMGVTVASAYKNSEARKSVEQDLAAADVNIPEKDLSLLFFMQYTAHESGHILQSGLRPHVIKVQDQGDENININDTTAALLVTLGDKPGATGNLTTDARIYNERFAEGYGLAVMSEAARLLGYDQSTIDALVTAFKIPSVSMETKHLLQQVTADKSLATLFQEKGIKDGNVGELGYTMPLSVSELADDLARIDTALKEGTQITVYQGAYNNVHAYQKMLEIEQSGTTASAVASAEFAPERSRRITKLRRVFGHIGLRR